MGEEQERKTKITSEGNKRNFESNENEKERKIGNEERGREGKNI